MFPDPDRFDIHRKLSPGQNLAFGYGPHRCQAEWLSRLEVEVAIGRSLPFRDAVLTAKGTLFERLPNMKVAVAASELEYTPPTQNVGVVRLPVWF